MSGVQYLGQLVSCSRWIVFISSAKMPGGGANGVNSVASGQVRTSRQHLPRECLNPLLAYVRGHGTLELREVPNGAEELRALATSAFTRHSPSSRTLLVRRSVMRTGRCVP
jgi:hypothetical protein